jgi:cell filamentation protein
MAETKKSGRYDASKFVEGQFEPGSRGRVLKNLLGVKRKREMDQIEAQELRRASEEVIRIYHRDHRFTEADIRRIHRIWLSPIYAWAGRYRNVNLVKAEFPFAAAREVPHLMAEFEKRLLHQLTPCRFPSNADVVKAIALVHTELMLIHPFREGNGRIGRLLAVLMALQAGLPPLDFGTIKGRKRRQYFAAVRSGLDRDYEPMERVFSDVIRRTLSARSI